VGGRLKPLPAERTVLVSWGAVVGARTLGLCAGVVTLARSHGDLSRLPCGKWQGDVKPQHPLFLSGLVSCPKHDPLSSSSCASPFQVPEKRESIVQRTAAARLPTKFGNFQVYSYTSSIDGIEHAAIVKVGAAIHPLAVRVLHPAQRTQCFKESKRTERTGVVRAVPGSLRAPQRQQRQAGGSA